jgi:hypothetical protein
LYPLVITGVLTLLGTLAQANEPPAFGVITSVTGSSQFVIDIKSSADAQPERNQRIINVAGVRGVRQDANGIYALERQILGRDVELSGCTRVPLAPDQLSCHVMINMGRSLNPSVNLAAMLSTWGLVQLTQPLAAPPQSAAPVQPAAPPLSSAPTRQPTPAQASGTPANSSQAPASGQEFKPFTPPPNLRKSAN